MRLPAILDDLSGPTTPLGTAWELVTDGVMGGVSSGALRREEVAGRPARRMTGAVRLENDGGFVQMALDLAPGGGAVDASRWAGLELDVFGNGETYGLHLRTTDCLRPWQSYRASFAAPAEWRTVHLPFAEFAPHRIEAPLRLDRVRRLGLVAIGRAFAADLALGGLRAV